MPAKIERIQYLRAAAALSVVLAHAIGDYKTLTSIDLLPLHYLGAAGVDLFFVISGFVMIQSSDRAFGAPHAAVEFLTRRWFRIAPLYWLVMAGYALLQIAQGKWQVIDPARIVASALFFPVRAADGSMAPFYGVGWTLNFEMFFYVVFALWLGVRRRLAIPGIAATIGVAVIAGQMLSLPQPLAYWSHSIILDFLFGVLIATAYERGWSIPRRAALPLIAAAISAIIVGGAVGFNATLPEVSIPFPRWIAWGLPAAIIVAAVTLCRNKSFELLPAFGHRLGDASYSMYLLHPIVIVLMRKVVPAVDGPALPWHYLVGGAHIAAVAAITALLAIASFAALEHPMIRFGKATVLHFRGRSATPGPMPRVSVKADV